MELTDEILEKLKKAGKIAAEALEYSKTLIKPGNYLLEATEKIESRITELGGQLAFPVQISMNDTAAHFCPASDDKTVFKDQIVKVDIGVHIDGWIGDTAMTIDLSQKNEPLVKASRDALNSALKIIRPEIQLREIGRTIHEVITSYGFSPIRNLSGHGLEEYNIHAKPSVPNYDDGNTAKLEENQLIAIEPFATDGAGVVYESSNANVFVLLDRKPVRMPMIRNILNEIDSYNWLPFTPRWL